MSESGSKSLSRGTELEKKDSEKNLSIDSTTSRHYSHDDWLRALNELMENPRGIPRITIENIRRSLEDE